MDHGGGTRPGASCHGRRLLRLVPIEDALGAVELAGHVIGVVVDLPGRAPQRVVGDARSKHAPLDAGGLDDVPDRLIVPVEVVREPDEIEAGIAATPARPASDEIWRTAPLAISRSNPACVTSALLHGCERVRGAAPYLEGACAERDRAGGHASLERVAGRR